MNRVGVEGLQRSRRGRYGRDETRGYVVMCYVIGMGLGWRGSSTYMTEVIVVDTRYNRRIRYMIV